MSMGSAPMGNVPGTTNLPPDVQGPTMPAQMAAPQAEDPGMWAQIKGIIGKSAGDFVQSMGDTPEERQQNLALFSKSIGAINQLGQEVSQSTLMQRLGKKRGEEMVQEQAAASQAAMAAAMQPLPPMSPEAMERILRDIGLGVSGIKEATTRGR
jgi:hypothetical protein